MGVDTRICKACGTEYDYCPKCLKYSHLPSWMWKCDTEECKDVLEVISAYHMGLKTPVDIKIVLDKHNITNFDKFTNSIQTTLKELFPVSEGNKKMNRTRKMDIDLDTEEVLPADEEIADDTLAVDEGISEI